MTSQTILSSNIPVTILSPTAPPPPEPPTTQPTLLDVLLTYTPASPSLSLTLSDLSTRLLLLQQTITPATYAQIRREQGLTVDLPAFPAYLADLLTLPLHDPRHAAQLHLPEPPAEATFRIVERHACQVSLRFELQLSRAPTADVLAALVARRRQADEARCAAEDALRSEKESAARAAAHAREELAARDARLEEAEERHTIERTSLSARDEELAVLKRRVSSAEEARAAVEVDLAEAETRAAERDAAREDARRSFTELRRVQEELDGVRESLAEMPVLRERASVGEAARGREEDLLRERDIAREAATAAEERLRKLATELKTTRAKGRVKMEVIARQEDKVAALERDVCKLRDRLALVEVEKEGLNGRLAAAQGKLEENAAAIKSDQRVIAYLNKELNRRAVGEGGAWQGGVGRSDRTSRTGGSEQDRGASDVQPNLAVT